MSATIDSRPTHTMSVSTCSPSSTGDDIQQRVRWSNEESLVLLDLYLDLGIAQGVKGRKIDIAVDRFNTHFHYGLDHPRRRDSKSVQNRMSRLRADSRKRGGSYSHIRSPTSRAFKRRVDTMLDRIAAKVSAKAKLGAGDDDNVDVDDEDEDEDGGRDVDEEGGVRGGFGGGGYGGGYGVGMKRKRMGRMGGHHGMGGGSGGVGGGGHHGMGLRMGPLMAPGPPLFGEGVMSVSQQHQLFMMVQSMVHHAVSHAMSAHHAMYAMQARAAQAQHPKHPMGRRVEDQRMRMRVEGEEVERVERVERMEREEREVVEERVVKRQKPLSSESREYGGCAETLCGLCVEGDRATSSTSSNCSNVNC